MDGENFVVLKYDIYLKPSGQRLLGSVFLSDSNGAISHEDDRTVDLALFEEESPTLITDWREFIYLLRPKELQLQIYIK